MCKCSFKFENKNRLKAEILVFFLQKFYYLIHRRKHSADSVNSEEQVYQLMRFANHFFLKDKETARRLLQLNVPTIIPMSKLIYVQIDDPTIVSLYDLLQEVCKCEIISALRLEFGVIQLL